MHQRASDCTLKQSGFSSTVAFMRSSLTSGVSWTSNLHCHADMYMFSYVMGTSEALLPSTSARNTLVWFEPPSSQRRFIRASHRSKEDPIANRFNQLRFQVACIGSTTAVFGGSKASPKDDTSREDYIPSVRLSGTSCVMENGVNPMWSSGGDDS